jgi:curved DNA-binding protein CbpA
MKLNSKYFDCIRVKPDEDRLLRDENPSCEWPGCRHPAQHPAPRGRGREGQYFKFCTEHVREYNKSYNYFNGMSDGDVAEFQKANLTGHRPTWTISTNGRKRAGKDTFTRQTGGFMHGFAFDDPLGVLGKAAGAQGPRDHEPAKPVRKAERKCLRALDLDSRATGKDIKKRFKLLVKRHHPDHNGGDRRSEDKLREVIQAYNYLKQAGLC